MPLISPNSAFLFALFWRAIKCPTILDSLANSMEFNGCGGLCFEGLVSVDFSRAPINNVVVIGCVIVVGGDFAMDVMRGR